MYRFLFTRQWVFLTLLGLVLIPTMIKLGFWQLHRHESRVAHNQLVTRSLAAGAVPVDRISGVRHEPRTSDEYRSVTTRGHYDAAHQIVVRQRTDNDGQTIGYFLVTPLIRHDGSAVLINRGWIPADGDLTKFPKVPPTPRGTVSVTGRIMPDETAAASGIKDRPGLPPRQVMLINSQQQTRALHRPVLDGYVQLLKTSPAPHGKQPQQLKAPDHSSIGPHMAYTIQWWLFAAGVPYGWVVLVRRERSDRLAAAAEEAEAAEAAEKAEADDGDSDSDSDGTDGNDGTGGDGDASPTGRGESGEAAEAGAGEPDGSRDSGTRPTRPTRPTAASHPSR